ncbi:MAG: 4Fe-4S dicluster domain-containing protein [Nitrospinota bacterium]|nr:4Fe-4S dicluster domain-containing protein [Nitrospinota bacterium]
MKRRKAAKRLESRREFIKIAANGMAGMLIVTLMPKSSWAQRIHQIEEMKHVPDWMDHYYAYVVDTTKCIGCGACVRACKRENNTPDGYFRTWVERYQITDTGHVYIDSPNGGHESFPPKDVEGKALKGFFVPKLCNHCRNTPCTQVCPVNASYETPQGVVLVDKQTCIGCGYCVQACPYDTRYIDPRTHTADKCTWCYHRVTKGLAPACVTVCPTKARIFGDLKVKNSQVREILDSQRVMVLKPELNTEPYCFYIGLDRAVR